MTAPDDNDLAITGHLPEDPIEGAKRLVDAPRIRTERDLLETSIRRALSTKERNVCTTGNYDLDQKTGGLLPGWFWLVGADTGIGKTSFVIAVADDNLRLGRGVIIVSLEDPESMYGDRLMLRRCLKKAKEENIAPVSADRMRLGKLTASDKELMMRVAQEGQRKPMFVDACGSKGEKIARDVERILDNMSIDLVVIDYLQEVHSERQHNSTRDKVTEMCRGIREVVRSRGKCLIITSQVTVDDPDKWPRRNQIRDSRDVVNAAEVVLMLGIAGTDIVEKNKREGTERTVMTAGERGALVDKCKQGRKGFVRLPWDDTAACFVSIPDPDDQRYRTPAPDIDDAADNPGDEWWER
jgi:replicative DNA helicase